MKYNVVDVLRVYLEQTFTDITAVNQCVFDSVLLFFSQMNSSFLLETMSSFFVTASNSDQLAPNLTHLLSSEGTKVE
jgi:hypothetical protein